MAIKNIEKKSPQVSVEGEISLRPTEVEDVTNAMVVGPSETGPVLVPTEIRTKDEFKKVFGNPKTYSSFCASEILEQTDRVNFTRILSTKGWDPSPIVISGTAGSSFPEFSTSKAQNILAVLIFSEKYKREEDVVPEKTVIEKSTALTPKTVRSFVMKTFNSKNEQVDRWKLSLDSFNLNYIEKILPPKIRVYQNFKESQRKALDKVTGDLNISLQVYGENSTENPLSFDNFDAPRTPWITSQEYESGKRQRLFRIWNRSDGFDENKKYKLSVVGIKKGTSESGWPLFSIKIRDFDDTDLNQNVIEQFTDLSLNPDDERFIGKVIGTKYKEYNQEKNRIDSFGVFDQKSLNVRVEIANEIEKATKNTVPFGFEGYKQTFTASSQVPVYRTEQKFPGRLLEYLTNDVPKNSDRGETIRKNLHLGIEFRIDQNKNFFQGVPKGAEKVDSGFQLDDYVDIEKSTVDQRKFTLGFQGGSDGQSIYKERFTGGDIEPQNTFGLNLEDKFSGGQQAYKKAFELLRESQGGYDFNLLTTPELDLKNHRRIVREAEKLVRNRLDSFYIFDSFGIETSPEEAINQDIIIDSSFAATYYGWVSPTDSNFDYVPPSAVIPQTYAKNDSIADPWFAPAGPTRGVIPNVKNLNERLTRDQINQLYQKSVNAIRVDNVEGIISIGNKCITQKVDGPVSSIDVRRTVVAIVSRIQKTAQDYLFEQINPQTARRFRSDVFDVLSTIQTREGIKNYKVDISNPTDQQRISRMPNTIKCSVSIIPRTSSEYITIDFQIREQGINVVS